MKPKNGEKCSTCRPHGLNYWQFIEYSEKAKKRQRQIKCQECGKWNWPEFVIEKTRKE